MWRVAAEDACLLHTSAANVDGKTPQQEEEEEGKDTVGVGDVVWQVVQHCPPVSRG